MQVKITTGVLVGKKITKTRPPAVNHIPEAFSAIFSADKQNTVEQSLMHISSCIILILAFCDTGASTHSFPGIHF